MSLKNNNALKYFALLLFTFELLSPVFLFSSVKGYEESNPQISLHSTSHSLNLLTFLICEEAGNEEERESKEHKAICFVFESGPLQFCYLPEKFEPVVEPFDQSDQESSQPSRIVLHRSYRI